jgi:hypothetical protein
MTTLVFCKGLFLYTSFSMNNPAAEQRGIQCHAGPDPASSVDFWIPAFAGMTARRKRRGIKP